MSMVLRVTIDSSVDGVWKGVLLQEEILGASIVATYNLWDTTLALPRLDGPMASLI